MAVEVVVIVVVVVVAVAVSVMMIIIIVIIITIILEENFERCQKPFLHITDPCRALAKGDYIHGHHQVAKVVHQELAIKCGLRKGPLVPHYKYEPQTAVKNSYYKLYYDRSISTD